MSDPVIIIGAGLAGLCCAHYLAGKYRILERETRVGGTARSNSRNDFICDVTGHWLHLDDDPIRALVDEVLGGDLLRIARRATIYSHGVHTPYPFQAHTHGLPPAVIADCVLGYFRAREAAATEEHGEPGNFAELIRQEMGDGIAEHFLLPYNTKLWGVAPAEMSHLWAGRFVPIPTPEEVVRGALEPAGAGHRLGYNAHFLYPRQGGIERLPAALAARLATPVELSAAVTAIDWRAGTVCRGDGAPVSYRTLVSTMPLDDLVACLVDPPEAIRAAAAALRARSVTYWDVGVRGSNASNDPHWTYYPAPEVPFYRVGSASAAAAHVAPPDHRSYYVEVAHPRGEPCAVTDADILAGLRLVGVLADDVEPVMLQRSIVDCAYVVMDGAYGPARRTLLDWLNSHRIWSIGRYGAWTYDSMAGAMAQGREAARAIDAA